MSIPTQAAEDYSSPTDGYDEPPRNGDAPPQAVPAEQSVLGGMLLSKDAIGDVCEIIKPHDYYRPSHEMIHRAIVTLYSRGEPADPITVTAELTKSGEIIQIGGPAYLHMLVSTVPTAANAAYYAELVREQAILRRLVKAGDRIKHMGMEGRGDVALIVDAAQSELFGVAEQRAEEECLPLAATMFATIEHVEELGKRGTDLTGISTGFADLDQVTRGLQGGQMVIVAARPAMGKSTLALDFARACSIKNGLPSAFFSLEMGRQEIEMRLLSAEAKVPLDHLRSGKMTDDDWARVAGRTPEISAAPLYIDVSTNLTAMDIRTKARRLKQRHDLRMVVVDYLQLMQSGARRPESRQQEVSDMSRSLKLLAKELDIPVVALCQLNRGPEQRTDKKPVASDLRESGSLEQDADIVILLHREDAYEKESERAGEADLILAKHRNGPTCTITVAAQLHYSRFVDMART